MLNRPTLRLMSCAKKTPWMCVTPELPPAECLFVLTISPLKKKINIKNKTIQNVNSLTDGCILTGIFQAVQVWMVTVGLEAWEPGVDCLVPVALASFSLLQEGPYQRVHNVRLVLLQPVARPRDDVETEVVADVEAARLGHLLF